MYTHTLQFLSNDKATEMQPITCNHFSYCCTKVPSIEINSGTKVNLICLDKGQKGKYTRSHNSVQNKGITCN